MTKRETIVAITGASGSIYGLRLVDELLKRGGDVNLIISPSGFLVIEHEISLRLGKTKKEIETGLKKYFKNPFKKSSGHIKYHSHNDLLSLLASGSSLKKDMIICPCSMGTLARIAAGISGNLIERTADVVLKEKGRLIIVPRETPLNQIHLENMLKLCKMGVHIIPAMPAFYHKPKIIGDMVDFVVGKTLDAMGIENKLYKRWKPSAIVK
ncbi:MAG: UbiX family flavin prenyltransferase [Deltaproteobacteria bacterium]|nr:UbiX family flavin prenyltransferase [Deltaproteobacteria bacterium]